jgi:hypothetical protein
MTKSIKLSLLFCAFVSSPLAFAAKLGLYGDLGLGLGFGPTSSVVKNQYFSHSGGTLSANPSDVYSFETRGVPAGYINVGYNFFPYLGAEADVTKWGRQNVSSFANNISTQTGQWRGNLNSYSYGVNAVGYLPLADSPVNLFAKVGLAKLHSTLEISDPNGSIFFNPGSYQMTSTEPGLVYAVGALYQFNRYVAGELEWKGINRFNDNRISNIHYYLIAMGVRLTLC